MGTEGAAPVGLGPGTGERRGGAAGTLLCSPSGRGLERLAGTESGQRLRWRRLGGRWQDKALVRVPPRSGGWGSKPGSSLVACVPPAHAVGRRAGLCHSDVSLSLRSGCTGPCVSHQPHRDRGFRSGGAPGGRRGWPFPVLSAACPATVPSRRGRHVSRRNCENVHGTAVAATAASAP